jgi:acyl-CoA synthetase (AMP-forming)/AMP-acid ligase II
LSRHPAVQEACIFGVPNPHGGETFKAAFALREGAESMVPKSRTGVARTSRVTTGGAISNSCAQANCPAARPASCNAMNWPVCHSTTIIVSANEMVQECRLTEIQ